MALQILSDLHLEAPKVYNIFDNAPKAPFLALRCATQGRVHWLSVATTGQFRAVLFVPGNHEAYHFDWPRTLHVLRVFENAISMDTSLGALVLSDRAAF
jgi:hypothetical protein